MMRPWRARGVSFSLDPSPAFCVVCPKIHFKTELGARPGPARHGDTHTGPFPAPSGPTAVLNDTPYSLAASLFSSHVVSYAFTPHSQRLEPLGRLLVAQLTLLNAGAAHDHLRTFVGCYIWTALYALSQYQPIILAWPALKAENPSSLRPIGRRTKPRLRRDIAKMPPHAPQTLGSQKVPSLTSAKLDSIAIVVQ